MVDVAFVFDISSHHWALAQGGACKKKNDKKQRCAKKQTSSWLTNWIKKYSRGGVDF